MYHYRWKMKILTIVVCAMICCTVLNAGQYEDRIKNLTTQKLNREISDDLDCAFGYIEEFEYLVYNEECSQRNKTILLYHEKI